jgi:hypothetical protein
MPCQLEPHVLKQVGRSFRVARESNQQAIDDGLLRGVQLAKGAVELLHVGGAQAFEQALLWGVPRRHPMEMRQALEM